MYQYYEYSVTKSNTLKLMQISDLMDKILTIKKQIN